MKKRKEKKRKKQVEWPNLISLPSPSSPESIPLPADARPSIAPAVGVSRSSPRLQNGYYGQIPAPAQTQSGPHLPGSVPSCQTRDSVEPAHFPPVGSKCPRRCSGPCCFGCVVGWRDGRCEQRIGALDGEGCVPPFSFSMTGSFVGG